MYFDKKIIFIENIYSQTHIKSESERETITLSLTKARVSAHETTPAAPLRVSFEVINGLTLDLSGNPA